MLPLSFPNEFPVRVQKLNESVSRVMDWHEGSLRRLLSQAAQLRDTSFIDFRNLYRWYRVEGSLQRKLRSAALSSCSPGMRRRESSRASRDPLALNWRTIFAYKQNVNSSLYAKQRKPCCATNSNPNSIPKKRSRGAQGRRIKAGSWKQLLSFQPLLLFLLHTLSKSRRSKCPSKPEPNYQTSWNHWESRLKPRWSLSQLSCASSQP